MQGFTVDELIEKCRARDDDAFSELLSRYTPMISREVAAISADSLSHDELFSEASVALHTAVMRYDRARSEVTFGLYARICVHNRLLDLVRLESKLPTCQEYDEDDDAEAESPESELLLRDTAERLLDAARRELSDYEYRVLILYMQGYKTAEISKRLARSPKSVDNAKSRIFTRLRRTLGEGGKF